MTKPIVNELHYNKRINKYGRGHSIWFAHLNKINIERKIAEGKKIATNMKIRIHVIYVHLYIHSRRCSFDEWPKNKMKFSRKELYSGHTEYILLSILLKLIESFVWWMHNKYVVMVVAEVAARFSVSITMFEVCVLYGEIVESAPQWRERK